MEEIKRIPQRSEIAVEDTWNTADLYVSDEAWEADLKVLEASGDEAGKYAGKLGESGKILYQYLSRMEELDQKGSLLGNYCMRKADEDTRVAKYQAMKGQLRNP